MYLVKTPTFIQNIFSSYVWRLPSAEKVMYLTFDDGPIPIVTPWVLGQLNKFNAKATFFCVGENVQKHPEIFKQVRSEGHAVGNHTFNHLSGWTTENSAYVDNVEACARIANSKLFRPPYGRITPGQSTLLHEDYQIIMWDVLSGDFDKKITKKQCLKNVLGAAKSGSIIVFHDSEKAFDKLNYVLPKTLQHFSDLGFTFKSLESINNKPSIVVSKTA